MLSDYEKLRVQNIERNNAFMRDIGLLGVKPSKTTKRKAVPRKDEFELVRRSARIAQIESPMYTDVSIRPLQRKTETNVEDSPERNFERKPRSKSPSSSSPDSSRALEADLTTLLGALCLGCKLGQVSTKATVMAIANHGKVPSFSKYSGTCEWKNCVFLWVNYRDPKNEVENNFSESAEGHLCINWYGGSNVYGTSDIIEKLLSYSDATSTSTSTESPCVILFLRTPGEPYVCLGRLKYVSYDFKKHPVEFIWRLVDADKLREKTDFKKLRGL